jgi:hypothetical protein
LQQRDSPQDDAHLLDTTAQKLPQLLLSLLVISMSKAGRAIPQVCAKTFLRGIVLLKNIQAVRDLGSGSRDGERIVLNTLEHFAKHKVMEGEQGPPIQQAR